MDRKWKEHCMEMKRTKFFTSGSYLSGSATVRSAGLHCGWLSFHARRFATGSEFL